MDLFRSFWTKLTALEREQVPAAVKLSMLAYIMSQALSKPSCAARGDRLYDYCTRHSVPHRRVGKLIFASEHSQLREIERIWTLASANGVHDLRWLEPAQVREIEPARSEEHTSELQSLM